MVNRPTSLQLEALVEFLEQNPGIAKGLLRTSQGKQEIKRKWAQLATNINSLGGVSKDGPGWAKYWAEKKSGLKKQCSRYAASMPQTGGGVGDEVSILTGIDRRFVAVIGGQSFTTGDSSATNASPRRSRRLISIHKSENVEMDHLTDRLAAIEERRVEAECLTAEALADTSRRLDRVADAAEHIAQAITQVATALLEIANSLGR